MKSAASASLLATLAALARAQVVFQNGSFICPGPAADKSYCAGDSLSSNIIIRCSSGTGYPGNCNDNLAEVPPSGVKFDALCYQSSSTAGDADCAILNNGLVYPYNGSDPYPIPMPTSPTSTEASTSAASTATASSILATGTGALLLNSTLTSASVAGPAIAKGTGSPFRNSTLATAATTAVPGGTAVSPVSTPPSSTGTGYGAAQPTAGAAGASGTGGAGSSRSSSAPYPTSGSAAGGPSASAGPTPTAIPTGFQSGADRSSCMAGWLLAVALAFYVLG